jgi:hypothetical protein
MAGEMKDLEVAAAPFADLPASLLADVLAQTEHVSAQLLAEIGSARSNRTAFREQLEASGMIVRESDLGTPAPPTTCGADGSYAIERMLTADLAVAAAVAVEGLAPPKETRFWAEPRHTVFVSAEPHSEHTPTVLRAVMLGRELSLGIEAPHDLVLLDMTLTLPLIYFNQALNAAPQAKDLSCSEEFLKNSEGYLTAYAQVLTAGRTDRHFAGLPKYSTRREVADAMGWPGKYDDRGLLSLMLRSGELSKPLRLSQPSQEWHLNTSRLPDGIRSRLSAAIDAIVAGLRRVHVFYYKPQSWLPALRVEVAGAVAANPARLAAVVQGIKLQCSTAAMLEPYPLYLADRTVKATARSLPAFRHITTQQLAAEYDGDLGEVYLAMHGYRSESGV